MPPGDTRTGKRVRISNLLKVALIVITISALCLFFMVHQIERPLVEELPLSINYQSADLQRTHSYVQEIREETPDILQDDDTYFKHLLSLHSNSSQQNTFTSEFPSQRKSKSRRRTRRYSKSKPFSNEKRNIARFDSNRRLPNNSRSFSDDHRRSREFQSESHERPGTTKSPVLNNTEAEGFKQRPSEAQFGTNEYLESKISDDDKSKKAALKPKSFESNSESQQQNTDKRPYLATETSNNSRNSINSTGNHDNLQGNSMSTQVNSTSLSRHDGNVKGAITKNKSLDAQERGLLYRYNKTKSALKQHSRKAVSHFQGKPDQKIKKDNRNSDLSPNKSSEKVKTNRQSRSRKAVSHYQGKPESTLTKNLRDADQLPKTSSEKVKSSRGQHSSKVVSNYKRMSASKVTNDIRDSDQLPQATSEKRRSLLIFGDDRSGTTFVTKMFAADPQMFTVYEPLWVTKKLFHQLGITDPDIQARVVMDVVNALLSCQFTHSQAAKTFLAFTTTSWVGNGVFEKNVFRTSPFTNRTKSGKRFYPKLSRHPEFAEDVCFSKFNHSVVKVGQVRVPGEIISVFIPRVFRENPDTDVRVIQIVRDPRGSINSRIRQGWISDFTYMGFPEAVNEICGKISANIKFGRDFQSDHEWMKERYMEVTYREIATMPITTAKKIYKFAGFQLSDRLIDWIVRSTNPDEEELAYAIENPYSHVRDSSKNYLKWRKESPIKRVRIIEQQCKELLNLLGLDEVADEMETLCS